MGSSNESYHRRKPYRRSWFSHIFLSSWTAFDNFPNVSSLIDIVQPLHRTENRSLSFEVMPIDHIVLQTILILSNLRTPTSKVYSRWREMELVVVALNNIWRESRVVSDLKHYDAPCDVNLMLFEWNIMQYDDFLNLMFLSFNYGDHKNPFHPWVLHCCHNLMGNTCCPDPHSELMRSDKLPITQQLRCCMLCYIGSNLITSTRIATKDISHWIW